MTETLDDRSKRWKAAMRNADTGPLMIARDVVGVCDNWERYKNEVEDLTLGQFLGDLFGGGRKAAFWKRIAMSVESLGSDCRRFMHWQVAIWVFQTVSVDNRSRVVKELAHAYNDNGKNPLTPSMAKRLVRKLLGGKRKPGVNSWREYALQLEALCRKNGVALPKRNE